MADLSNINEPVETPDFTEIEKKAATRAAKSHSLDEIQKAVHIIRDVAQSRENVKKLESTCAKGAEAPTSRFRRWSESFASAIGPSLPSAAAALTAIALLCQVVVTYRTAMLQNKTSTLVANTDAQIKEDSQWRDAMKSVTLASPDGALVGAFEMESFFGSQAHGENARSIASTLLPAIDDTAGFDVVFFDLQHRISPILNEQAVARATRYTEIQIDLIGIGRMVANRARDLCQKATPTGCDTNDTGSPAFRRFVSSPGKVVKEFSDLKLALAQSWELDSVGHGLAALWAGQRKQLDPETVDLSGVVLAGVDLTNTNFSQANLKGALLWNSNFTGADLSKVEKFAGSDWQDTNWWKAKAISCDLVRYLKTNFSPNKPNAEDSTEVGKLLTVCPPVVPK
jgi:Pentapeptide repeats (8 copies)